MRTISCGLLFSASDLLNFLGCSHATWLDVRAVQGGPQPSDKEDAYTKLLQEKGLEHEKDYLWRLRGSGLSIEEIASSGTLDDRVAATRGAMRKGVDIIYQGGAENVPRTFRAHSAASNPDRKPSRRRNMRDNTLWVSIDIGVDPIGCAIPPT